MRYLIIPTEGHPFYSDWLIFPEWTDVIMIIDLHYKHYIRKENWYTSDDEINWESIPEDSL